MIRKTVIISGGFGDIGKATARKFAQNGYNIALTYLNSFDAEFITELKKNNIEVLAMHCDHTNENEVMNFVNSTFKEFDYVDAFVACAGKSEEVCLLTDKPTNIINDVISNNLTGTILFNREVLKHFQKQKHGNIVNISSIYGMSGGSLESVYSACKAGIIGLTKSLAVEVAPNIKVNCVSPGCIETKMTNNLTAEDKEYISSQTPLARIGQPEDVAKAVFFLASDENSYITGENILVSGGVVRY